MDSVNLRWIPLHALEKTETEAGGARKERTNILGKSLHSAHEHMAQVTLSRR